LNLTLVFRCAVELAEAVAAVIPSDWEHLPVNIEGPTSPHFERCCELDKRLGRIEEESTRLKRALGATGALTCEDRMADISDRGSMRCSARWESFDREFNDTAHDRIVRLALLKLATAAIDLSGFVAWRELQWGMREQGLRLLTWGVAQLWHGLTAEERLSVRDRLQRTHKAIGWPRDPVAEPPSYDGPEEIPLEDQHRVVELERAYVACYQGYLDDVQEANEARIREGQEKVLRRASLTQLVGSAERAAQALQAIGKREFDTGEEWANLYTTAFNLLACLRRAKEVPPVGGWPNDALEQRNLMADAAHCLLVCVGGTPESKEGLKPEDANKAFADFTRATNRLREIATLQTSLTVARMEVDTPHPAPQNAQAGSAHTLPPELAPLAPKQYLMTWLQILDALDLRNTGENQRRVREMNKMFDGPIILPKKGGQPKVSKDKLLTWWNGLEELFQESEKKQADTQATLQVQHDYGRDGKVLPDIIGHVKKRRGKKSGQ
jgi:hypothetical protein